MQHRPMNDQVLIKIDKHASEHAGYDENAKFELIVMPENIEKQFRFTGWVLATGPKTVEGLMPGEYVIFGTYQQMMFTMTSSPHQYTYVSEENILSTLSEQPETISVVIKGTRELVEAIL